MGIGKVLINIKSEPWAWQLTNCSRGIHNAWRFGFELALVFTASAHKHQIRALGLATNKLFKRDSQRLAVWV
ncbi:hypothetical protein BSG35_17980 [Vibrio parahaemolyticus]|nr:hypothetical protein BSG35_17980 [Vibrio parahaemolyticus]